MYRLWNKIKHYPITSYSIITSIIPTLYYKDIGCIIFWILAASSYGCETFIKRRGMRYES